MPNALSAVRILLIPVFVALLVDQTTRLVGFLLLGAVVATDWVDGYVARRTGQVTELGKVLDPIADRLALAAALVTFIVLGLLPLWAAMLVLVRDIGVTIVVLVMAALRAPRIEVRQMGKNATFTLMWAIPMIAWGNAGLPLAATFRVLGWVWFAVGIVEYYVATVQYAGDIRRALARRTAE